MSLISDEYDNAGEFGTSPTAAAINSYVMAPLKHLFGIHPKPTKRSLSEEAECGSPESLSEWLRRGSDVNEVDPYGYTPLVNASLRGCKKSVQCLINNGADVNKKAIHGYSPLHAAAQNGHAAVAAILIDNGADMEARNNDGDTALMLAVRSEHTPVVDLLCQRGCNLHTTGFDKIEPLNYALNKRNRYMSDVLMKHERHQSMETLPVTTSNQELTTTPCTISQKNSDSVFHADD